MAQQAELVEAAADVLLRAHAPYSKLRVGAALRSGSGRIHVGCNVESAAYPLGGCAERHAIAAAVQAEGAAFRLVEIAICALDRDGNEAPIPPCGGCRQLIHEFGREAAVVFLGRDGRRQRHRIGDLLPLAFER